MATLTAEQIEQKKPNIFNEEGLEVLDDCSEAEDKHLTNASDKVCSNLEVLRERCVNNFEIFQKIFIFVLHNNNLKINYN
ncbi:MAG: hypothetical protein J6U14_01740 [Bacteroidaceae bacterium]|nr:hypothetical protein [Bacteroidaceae bacterium]